MAAEVHNEAEVGRGEVMGKGKEEVGNDNVSTKKKTKKEEEGLQESRREGICGTGIRGLMNLGGRVGTEGWGCATLPGKDRGMKALIDVQEMPKGHGG